MSLELEGPLRPWACHGSAWSVELPVHLEPFVHVSVPSADRLLQLIWELDHARDSVLVVAAPSVETRLANVSSLLQAKLLKLRAASAAGTAQARQSRLRETRRSAQPDYACSWNGSALALRFALQFGELTSRRKARSSWWLSICCCPCNGRSTQREFCQSWRTRQPPKRKNYTLRASGT